MTVKVSYSIEEDSFILHDDVGTRIQYGDNIPLELWYLLSSTKEGLTQEQYKRIKTVMEA